MNQNSRLPQKVIVVGNSCAGKTTFSKKFAEKIGAKHIELDSLFWEADWKEAETDIFKKRVTESITAPSWIVDGNYINKVQDIVWGHADTYVWLNPSLFQILTRFTLRSFKRALGGEILWGGCKESLRNSIFQKNSLLVWILKTHKKYNRTYQAVYEAPPPGVLVYQLRNQGDIDSFFQKFDG